MVSDSDDRIKEFLPLPSNLRRLILFLSFIQICSMSVAIWFFLRDHGIVWTSTCLCFLSHFESMDFGSP